MGSKINFSISLLVALSLLTLGCLRQQEDPSALKASGYMGCSGAVIADDAVSVRVDVVMPESATEVQVLRNGTVVGSVFHDDADLFFIDSSIPRLGDIYRYSCKAVVAGEGVIGVNQPTVQTQALDAPTFTGIDTVTIINNTQAKLTWKAPSQTGAKATKYKIYANLETGSHTDLTATPLATVVAPASTYTIAAGELGDYLNYSFSVMACTSNDLCSGGNTYKNASTLDSGAALTTGIQSWNGIAGGLHFVLPWTHKMGEIRKRYIYVNKPSNTTGGLDFRNNYNQLKVIDVPSATLYNPTLRAGIIDVNIVDAKIIEKSTQHFIVRDVDTQNHDSQLYYLMIPNTGDLTAPVFSGLSSYQVKSGFEDTKVDITFTAIDREGTADAGQATGASNYKVYFTSTPYVNSGTATPNDPCTYGTAYSSLFPAAPYTPATTNTLTLTGLTPRTYYRFCLKAVDAAGNESGNQDPTMLPTIATWDKTAPVFDGIQSFSGVSIDGLYRLKAEWNPANDLSSNVKYYKIKAWVGATTYAAATRKITATRNVTDGWTSYGYLFNNVDLKYDDNVQVYAIVDACDDASTIPGVSADNCTASNESDALTVTPPDIIPPDAFQGIDLTWFSSTLPTAATPANGQVIVKFKKPTWFDTPASAEYADYVGFNVYTVDGSNNITLIKACPCATAHQCNSTTDLQCTLTGLTPDKTYKFHARAYDAGGNVTTYLDPQFKSASQRVLDTVAPTYTAGLAVTYNPTTQKAQVTWTAATDNQDSASTITYKIYRKKSSAWTSGEKVSPPTAYYRGSSTTTSYLDGDQAGETASEKLTGGGRFFYLACAFDNQNNRTCDPIDKELYLADVVAPVLGSLTSDKTNDTLTTYKKWYLKFYVEENESVFAAMSIKVYSKYSASAPSAATTSDPVDPASIGANISFSSTDSGVNKKGYVTINNFVGSSGVKGYMNYLIEVMDENGNRSTLSTYFAFDNTITLTSIANTSGTMAGGRLVVINGSGFSDAANNNVGTMTQILFGGVACVNPTILTSTILTCTTPAVASSGPKTVTMVNPDGTQASLINGYTFTDGIAYAYSTCDTAPQNAYTTQFSSGTGADENHPYIICNADQVQLMGNATYVGAGKYYRIEDNIDLSSLTGFTPIGTTAQPFIGSVDVAGHLLSNLTYTNSSATKDSVAALFGVVKTTFGFKNAALVNFNMTANVTLSQQPSDGLTGSGYAAIVVANNAHGATAPTALTLSNITIVNSTAQTNSVYRAFAGALFGWMDTQTNGNLNVIENITVQGTTITAPGYNSTKVGSSNTDLPVYNFVNMSKAGGLGGYLNSATKDVIKNITISSTTVNCGFYCGGGFGYVTQANLDNWTTQSVTLNVKNAGVVNFRGTTDVGGVSSVYGNNYIGSQGAGGAIGHLHHTTSVSNLTLSTTINRVQAAGDQRTVFGSEVNDALQNFNYSANFGGSGSSATTSKIYPVSLDRHFGGAFGKLMVTGADATLSHIRVTANIASVGSGASGSFIKPLYDVGGVFGGVLAARGSGSATNVGITLNDVVVSGLTASCTIGCGGIGGYIATYSVEATGTNQYNLNFNMTKSGVTATFNDTSNYTQPKFKEDSLDAVGVGYLLARGAGGFFGSIHAIENAYTAAVAAGSGGGGTPAIYHSALAPKVTVSESYTRTSFQKYSYLEGSGGGAVGQILLVDEPVNAGGFYLAGGTQNVLTLNNNIISTELLNTGASATNSANVVGDFKFISLGNVGGATVQTSDCFEVGQSYILPGTTSSTPNSNVTLASNNNFFVGKASKLAAAYTSSSTTSDPATMVCSAAVNANNIIDSTIASTTNYYGTATSCSGFTTATTAEMKNRSGTTFAAWDFSTVWSWPSGSSTGYPVLQWMGE